MRGFPSQTGLFMKSREVVTGEPVVMRPKLPLRVALWLLDQPRIGQAMSVKRFAGHLLKTPARQGVVQAQARLGQLLCSDCDNPRDRRIGMQLLRQAARAGDRQASELATRFEQNVRR